MSSPTSVIRRYTPPTCTLEIAAKNSPLSRWMGQSVLKHLRFKLSFDDPRVNEDQWITVHGDRAQLEALHDAVTHYVQNFLSQSNRVLAHTATLSAPESAPDFKTEVEQNSSGIYLQPKGLISHELHLGTLSGDRPTLQLSAVQLADLASALDEYSADVTALPNLERPRWLNSTPAWGTIAAALIVAIGVTASLARVFEPSPAPQTASNSGVSSDDQRLPVQPLPTNSPPNSVTTLPTAPLPLPNGSATPPAPRVNAPTAPQQSPTVRIAQEPPVNAPVPQVGPQGITIQEAPVPAIPDQTKPAPASSAKPRSTARNAEPTPPGTNSQIASSSQADSPSLQAAPSSASTARSAATSPPQVAEAKAFFQSRWQPPKELTEPIQYRLVLAPDGTVFTNEPLGEVAGRFVDRTPIPFIGTEKIASPIRGGGKLTIRLLLKPDGSVQTFPE